MLFAGKVTTKSGPSIPQSEYSLHNTCPCTRTSRSLQYLQSTFDPYIFDSLQEPLPLDGAFVGRSTCNDYASSLGSGQKVLSYSFYIPQIFEENRFFDDGRPTKHIDRYTEILPQLAESIGTLYPTWRMRIYHNVSGEEYQKVARLFCNVFCKYPHVDFCPISNLPLAPEKTADVGLFFRFRPIGDPTVRYFMSRDLDSFILEREVGAVHQWLTSNLAFHVMRDHPLHHASVLGGLWGFKNYFSPSTSSETTLSLRAHLLLYT